MSPTDIRTTAHREYQLARGSRVALSTYRMQLARQAGGARCAAIHLQRDVVVAARFLVTDRRCTVSAILAAAVRGDAFDHNRDARRDCRLAPYAETFHALTYIGWRCRYQTPRELQSSFRKRRHPPIAGSAVI